MVGGTLPADHSDQKFQDEKKGGRVQKCLWKLIVLRISTSPTVYSVLSEHFDMKFRRSLLEGYRFF